MPQTHAAMLRDLTARTLIAQATLAEGRVEQERSLPLTDGEMPGIIVVTDESGEGQYQAGPRFLVTGNLQIRCFVQRARLEDALTDLDTLIWQVKDALFGEPAWVRAANQILSFNVKALFKGNQNQQLGEAAIAIQCQWLERIALRDTVPLTGMNLTLQPGDPDVTRPVTAKFDFPTS